MMTRFRIAAALALVSALLLPGLAAAAQQTTDFASQSLGRGYWHMFIAYAIAWLLVLGWTVSIGRRLAEVERRLDD